MMKQNRLIKFAMLFCLAIFGVIAHAVDNPYTVTLQVPSESEQDRLVAFRQGLTQVVINVTHDPNAALRYKVDNIQDFYPFITRYEYIKAVTPPAAADNKVLDLADEDLDDLDNLDNDGLGVSVVKQDAKAEAPIADAAATPPTANSTEAPAATPAPAETDPSIKRIMIQFNPTAVQNLMQAHAEVVQTSNATKLLFWLGINENGKAVVLTAESNPVLTAQLNQIATGSNLEFLYPMMDLDDIKLIRPDDVFNFNLSAITQASTRYGTDTMLIGSITPISKDVWRGQWLLINNGERFTWSDQGSVRDAVIVNAISKSAEYVNNPNLSAAKKNNRLQISIEGVDNVTDYAQVQAFFRNTTAVSQYQVIRVLPGKVTFEVVLSSTATELYQAMTESHRFEVSINRAGQENTFKWRHKVEE